MKHACSSATYKMSEIKLTNNGESGWRRLDRSLCTRDSGHTDVGAGIVCGHWSDGQDSVSLRQGDVGRGGEGRSVLSPADLCHWTVCVLVERGKREREVFR